MSRAVREPIQVYLTPEERAELDEAVREMGVSRSEVLRRGGLRRPPFPLRGSALGPGGGGDGDALAWLELRPPALERALHPFPMPVRTLDATHLASVAFLVERGREVELATYERGMAEAARAMGVGVWGALC